MCFEAARPESRGPVCLALIGARVERRDVLVYQRAATEIYGLSRWRRTEDYARTLSSVATTHGRSRVSTRKRGNPGGVRTRQATKYVYVKRTGAYLLFLIE